MRRQARNTLLLFLAVIALAGAAYWQLRRESGGTAPSLASLDTHSVQGIFVRCEGCTARLFERAQGRWWMRKPYDLPASEEAVQRLLAIPAAPLRRRLVAADLDARKIGLEPPQATLEFQGNSPLQLHFGLTEAINGDRYVRAGGEVLLVPDRFSGWLFAPPESELDRRLVSPATPLREVRIDGVVRTELVSAWANAQASRIVAAARAEAPAGTQRQIDLILADRTKPLHLRLWRSDAGYLLQREEPALVYVFDEASMQQLLPAH